MSKQEMRGTLAALSFSEKIEILEKLRDRSLAFAAAGLRSSHAGEEASTSQHFCDCSDWEPCNCGNQPPHHCMRCCRELTQPQISAAKERGFYLEDKR